MKHLLTYFKNMDPTSSENVGSNYSLGQEWYNTVTGDKFYHKSDGVWVKSITDVSSLIIEVTYSELDTLKTNSLLIPGRVYLLTDYMTRYEQPVSGDIISSGVVEPLYITATGVNTLNNICMSKLYPQDIVYYEITGIIDQNYGTEGFNKGKIYRRIDTIRNNDIGTDWRHIKYRRYALNVTNSYLAGTSYVREDVVNNELFIYICVEDDPNSTTLNSKKWFRYIYNNGQYRSLSQTEVLVTLYSSYSPDAASIPVDSADYQDYPLFPIIGGGDYYTEGHIYNNTINTYNLSNNVIYGRFNNNTINTRFVSNNIGIAERNLINCVFGENNINELIGNTIIGSSALNTPFGQNHIKSFQQNQVTSSFSRNFIISTNFRWNTIGRDFVGNTIYDNWQGNNIGEFVTKNLITGIFYNVNINFNFNDNIIRRSFSLCNFNGPFRFFDIPEATPDDALTYWTFKGQLIGYGVSLPVIVGAYVPTMYAAVDLILVKYDDVHGDTIILGQPETFSFRSNQEYISINGNTLTSARIRIEWGDTEVWISPLDVGFNSPTHTYPNKTINDEYDISIGGNNITALSLSSNGLTYFNPINLPSTLQIFYLNDNLLTGFDPLNALPSPLTQLNLSNNLLTTFEASSPLPIGLEEFTLQNNQLNTTEVNNVLVMLNTRYVESGYKYFDLRMSPPATPSGAGIAAYIDLLAKGYTVYTD